MALQSIKRRLGRWLRRRSKVVLLRSSGYILVSLLPIWFILIILKCIYFRCVSFPLLNTRSSISIPFFDYMDAYIEYYIKYIQYYVYQFLLNYPYSIPIWNSIPVFNRTKPFSLLTENWITLVILIGLNLLGWKMVRKKIGEDSMPTSINVYGSNIGVINTGVMDIKKIESIAAHLNQISSTSDNQIASDFSVRHPKRPSKRASG
jgi:hypothetical protein